MASPSAVSDNLSLRFQPLVERCIHAGSNGKPSLSTAEHDIADTVLSSGAPWSAVAEPLCQTAQPGSAIACPRNDVALMGYTAHLPSTVDFELMCPVQLSDWKYSRELMGCSE